MTVFVAGGAGTIGIPRWLFRMAEPYLARMLAMDLSLSNEDARRELKWSPSMSSYRAGLAATFAAASYVAPVVIGRAGRGMLISPAVLAWRRRSSTR